MRKKEFKSVKAGAILSTFAIAVTIGILMVWNIGEDLVVHDAFVKEYKRQMRRVILSYLGDNNPGSGASGVLTVFIYPHAANPGTTYASNISSGWYAQGDVNNSNIGSNVPYAPTTFDIVFKVRWNETHACNESGGQHNWRLDWVNAFCNCSALSISSAAMSEQNISGCGVGTFIWVHYYMNNGGSGYSLYRGQNVPSCSANFNAYY